MKRVLLAWIACGWAAAAWGAPVVVAPGGDDAGPGTWKRPFATLAKARDAVREGKGERRIVLRGGVYHDVEFVLEAADSGLTVEAAEGERPVLYGGVRLSGWEKEGEWVSAALPAGSGAEGVRALEVGGEWAWQARFPAEGTLSHESVFDVRWMSSTAGGWERPPTPEELGGLRYRAGDLSADLDLKNAELTIFHVWDESRVGVSGHDPAARRLAFATPSSHPPGAFGVKKYIVRNTREGMTSPGRWFHDRGRGRIVYWPLPGQAMERTEVVAGTRGAVVRVRGTSGAPVRGVTLRGFDVAVTTVLLRAAGFAADALDGAISLDWAEDCTLSGLRVRHAAGHGISARSGIRGLLVRGCEVTRCGAGGIYAGGERARIEDNHIHRIGLGNPSAIGIYRGGKGGVVAHNEVHDTPYTAINYGGEENVIENNLIYRCMTELRDGGAVYLFGGKGCVVRGNVVREVGGGGREASAFYLDEQSEGCVVEGNLASGVEWPFQNHMAKKNVIRGNVCIASGSAKLTFSKSSDHVVEGNIIVAGGKIRIQQPAGVVVWKKNLFQSGEGVVEQVWLKNYTPERTEVGLPAGVVAGDPKFVDAAGGDYRFRPTSPASALGLKPIDVRGAGRRAAGGGR
jgi:hypothetical protein